VVVVGGRGQGRESISSRTKEVEEARGAAGSAEEEKKRRGDEVVSE
jgi:hypothetical protein